jgi:hypothetical protein
MPSEQIIICLNYLPGVKKQLAGLHMHRWFCAVTAGWIAIAPVMDCELFL